MDKFLINGPCKIKGSVKLSGSKNASLPILAATILFDEPVEIKNLPNDFKNFNNSYYKDNEYTGYSNLEQINKCCEKKLNPYN